MDKKIMLWSFFALSFSLSLSSTMCQSCKEKEGYDQWFVGPILTPNPTTVDPKHPGIEFVLFASNIYGLYSSSGKLLKVPHIKSLSPYIDFQFSVNKILGFEIIGSLSSNTCGRQSSTNLRDTFLRFGIQLSNEVKGTWVPDFRILVQETVPTGKFKNLNPEKKGCDLTGQGSFQTGIHFAFRKSFNIGSNHPFIISGDLGYFLPAAVSIKGLNYYGGNQESRGIVYPGNHFTFFLFGEYALTCKWAIACEFNYQKGWKGLFLRKRGENIVILDFTQLTLNPEIQYTLNANLGMVFGLYLTVKGKNSSAFTSCFTSILYIF